MELFLDRNFRKKRLNIEATARCTLKCPLCKRAAHVRKHGKVPQGWEMTPDQLEKVAPYFRKITFCGQLSDPVFAKHLIPMLSICQDYDIRTRVLTAATGRSEEWYEEAFNANLQAHWTFGIDGLPEKSHRYRINQDGFFLYKMMLKAKSYGMAVWWQYIIFDWNKDQINICKQMARENNIKILFIESKR
tara:strand:+ start:3042 stop:3611 length:570 start_codon:yes stop_codon:yes gene_type:complete